MKVSLLIIAPLATALSTVSCKSGERPKGDFAPVASQYGAPQEAASGIPEGTNVNAVRPSDGSVVGRGLPSEAQAIEALERRAAEMQRAQADSVQVEDRNADSAFARVYVDRGRPKMALFANRVLSDSVLEWTVQKGVQIDKDGVPRDYEIRNRNPLNDVEQDLQVAWMWAFEDGFTGTMADSGAQLVDRATVMRVVAANDGGTGEPERPLSVRQIELEGLRQHAEVLIELLVEPDDAVGFIMRARAIEVPSGVLLATATTDGVRPAGDRLPLLQAKAIRAGANGYETVTVTHDPNGYVDPGGAIGPREAASDLARELLSKMVATWQR